MHCRSIIPPRCRAAIMLLRCANGFGAVALWALLADEASAAAPPRGRDETDERPGAPLQAKAKSVIFLFMDGVPVR